ncbi:MAG: AAA family ATPase [Lachnospiraceae bacterium]|nr:AAA family ATPase [Lachnospiraceae bacterium]
MIKDKVSFEEYKSALENMTEIDKISKIICDMGCPHDFNCFYGVVSKELHDFYGSVSGYIISDIHPFYDINHKIEYPYSIEEAENYSVNALCKYSKYIKRGDKILFSISIGNLNKYNNLLVVRNFVKADETLYNCEDFNSLVSEFNIEVKKKFDKIRHDIVDETDRLKQDIKDSSDDYKLIMKKIEEDVDNEDRKISELKVQLESLQKSVNDVAKEFLSTKKKFMDSSLEAKYQLTKGSLNLSADSLMDISGRLKYSYPEDKIKTFLAALNTTQIIALCGKPGTGKTTFAKKMSESIGAIFHLIDVQNNWTDRTDLLGFYNPIDKTYQSTPFLDAILEAKFDYDKNNEHAHIHVICLDEMNLSRVEYYFATFLSLLQLEEEDRIITLLPRDIDPSFKKDSSGKDNSLLRYARFQLPPNVRFVGTMNMDDTAQLLSPKVIDRSIFVEFNADIIPEENKDYLKENVCLYYFESENFNKNKTTTDEILPSLDALKKVLEVSTLVPRLMEYMKFMWPVFKLLSKDKSDEQIIEEFVDMVLLSKVLPSLKYKIKNANNENIEISNKYPLSKKRYEFGIERGKSLNHFDADLWSFWE